MLSLNCRPVEEAMLIKGHYVVSSVDMPAPEPDFQSLELGPASLVFGSLQKVGMQDMFLS